MEVVTNNLECVNDIAVSEVMGYFLLALHSIQSGKVALRKMLNLGIFMFYFVAATQTILTILYAILSNTKLLKEAMAKGNLKNDV